MTASNPTPLPSVFSPLAKALLDAFSEGVIVFGPDGKVLYANAQALLDAKALLDAFSEGVIVFGPDGKVLYANAQARELGLDLGRPASDLMPALAELGGRLKPLRVGHLDLGEAMFFQGTAGPTTLAERERQAIVRSLD